MPTKSKSPAPQTSPAAPQKVTLQDVSNYLNQTFRERENVVNGMLVALLSKQMLFLLGPPGTAKSALCNSLCKCLDGIFFSWQTSKYTTPEELFGPISFKALESDLYTRVTAGKLPRADVAFIDEIFKGSSAILNTLLPIMNERTFYNGSTPEKIPLQVLFAASNELPEGEELAAMYDRFVLRYFVQEIGNDANMKALLGSAASMAAPHFGLDNLKAEQAAVQNVVIPEAMIDLLIQLRNEIKGQGMIVSDRKWVQIREILKAQAHLNGRTEVQAADFEILENVLWREQSEIKKARQLVAKYSNPLGQEILDITDGIRDVIASFNRKEIEDTEAHKKIKKGLERLRGLKKQGENNAKLDQAIEQASALHRKFMTEELGLM